MQLQHSHSHSYATPLCRRRCNQLKNRYTDVLCLDHSRVILNDSTEEKHNDYINANFVDGYKHKNAFISTQGIATTRYNACCGRQQHIAPT